MTSGEAHADERARQAKSFDAAADAYERGRPPYPGEAVTWLLDGAGPRVLDLGAGTGKLTRQLTARGLDVTAVEPSAGMRGQLAAAVPQARVLEGTAEAIPVPGSSVDAVLVAQAWHWVDTRRAVPEAARVLAPGGTLGLLWNIRDERDDWTAELGRLLHPEGAPPTSGVGTSAVAERSGPFGALETCAVEWRHELGIGELVDLVASRSYVITMPEAQRTHLLAQVRQLALRHPGLSAGDRLHMPYVTRCYRARRRA
ncbi:class I SAM-dependent methyltransferase [Streptacidiphilus griseoplanus]|uniref:class I SAM-dependent methyltransferase n=1 Tax=Peterkaempfera griseoplana TaxID=66896 RepID=UPI0006E256D5|nr:class I SAM-dependent methyltransferase [Peterkaempfera griseoplana]